MVNTVAGLFKHMVDSGLYREFMCIALGDLPIGDDNQQELIRESLEEIQEFMNWIAPPETHGYSTALLAAFARRLETEIPAYVDVNGFSPDHSNVARRIYKDWDNREVIFTEFLNRQRGEYPALPCHEYFAHLVEIGAYRKNDSYMCNVVTSSSHPEHYRDCIQHYMGKLHDKATCFGRDENMVKRFGKKGEMQALASHLHMIAVSRVGDEVEDMDGLNAIYGECAYEIYKDWANRKKAVDTMVQLIKQKLGKE